MFFRLFVFLLWFFLSPLLSLSTSKTQTKQDIDWWCNTTPYPHVCNHFMGGTALHRRRFKPRCGADFRIMTIQVAMEKIQKVEKHTKKLKNHCHTRKKKIVFEDCLKLLQNTILQLNRTIEGLNRNKTSDSDAQTWLSTALTNLETCRTGSDQLKATKFVSSIFTANISQLLSNSLSANAAISKHNQEFRDEFPTWLNSGDRKLLETSSNIALNPNAVILQHDEEFRDRFPAWITSGDRRLLETSLDSALNASAVVAKDGSGNFESIQAAINAAVSKRNGTDRIVIYVKRGVYTENILISVAMNKIMLVGDGLKYTIITGSRSVAGGYTTYSCATLGVDGLAFIARGITFQNTAGPQNGQAVALRSASDLSVFYSCSFEGYQDTLFVQSQRQFFKACYIYGTIDFIFGNAAVVFQNCMIYVRKPLAGQINVITAQGRTDPGQNTAISIQRSRIMAAPDLKPVIATVSTYLGRPWMQYSRTVFLKSYMEDLVNPEGWLAWEETNFALDTLYYGEYRNIGPGSDTSRRVNWTGYHVIKTSKAASQYSVDSLIAGKDWLPATNVPFTLGP